MGIQAAPAEQAVPESTVKKSSRILNGNPDAKGCSLPYLFSYGTLQQEEVQLSTFGRKLTGAPDTLAGYIIVEVRIIDTGVVATSGKEFHPIARRTGAFNHRIPGTIYEITEEELKHSDRYEVDAYKRVEKVLASGKSAWVYVEASSGST